jgi:phage baseplate assembly protein W
MASNGDFTKITDSVSLVQDLISALSIKKGSYAFNPTLGSNLSEYIFDFSDNFTYTAIKNEIELTLAKFQPDMTLVGDVSLAKTLNGNGLVVSFTVNILQKYTNNINLLVTNNDIIPLSGVTI